MGQLVIVSNRVAIPEKIAKARAGGLEVAVRGHSSTKLALGSAGAERSSRTPRLPHRRSCMTRLPTSRSISPKKRGYKRYRCIMDDELKVLLALLLIAFIAMMAAVILDPYLVQYHS